MTERQATMAPHDEIRSLREVLRGAIAALRAVRLPLLSCRMTP